MGRVLPGQVLLAVARAGVLAMINSGTESDQACATAVSALLTPGPEMTNTAAGRPLLRA